MKQLFAIYVHITLLFIALPAAGDVGLGVLSDFETNTTEGWSGNSAPTAFSGGGPSGEGDGYLRIGGGNRFATFNEQLSGSLDSAITAIQVDFRRPAEEPDLDMRLVLFGPSTIDRWTSSIAQVVPGNGEWNTYTFSVLEADLTRVLGFNTYEALTSSLNRIMFRYDPGLPDSAGIPAVGTLGIDSVIAIGSETLDGDFSEDGMVDGVDYARWREGLGSEFDSSQFVTWLNNFGAISSGVATTPEPTTALLILLMIVVCYMMQPLGDNRDWEAKCLTDSESGKA